MAIAVNFKEKLKNKSLDLFFEEEKAEAS